jgi:hypothetical protein
MAVVELTLPPPGEEARLEANKKAETEIRPRARVICKAEARTELSCFFFILFRGVLRSGGPFLYERCVLCQVPFPVSPLVNRAVRPRENVGEPSPQVAIFRHLRIILKKRSASRPG